ncbi:MAG: KOW motif domain-containing protein, partial [Myxococcota bacterium]
GTEADAPPAPPPPPAGPILDKGDRAEIVSGPDAGKQGEVFWTGQSRYSNQMRYGLKDDEGATYWVDQPLVKKLGGGGDARADEQGAYGAPPSGPNEAPPPFDPEERRLDDDLPPEATAAGEDPDFFNDPDEEIPF